MSWGASILYVLWCLAGLFLIVLGVFNLAHGHLWAAAICGVAMVAWLIVSVHEFDN